MSDTVVFVPAWNEEQNLPAVLDDLRREGRHPRTTILRHDPRIVVLAQNGAIKAREPCRVSPPSPPWISLPDLLDPTDIPVCEAPPPSP